MKPKISLSATLRGDEALFSPLRILLFILAGGLGFYLILSRTTESQEETKIFHGTQDIRSIYWKMNNSEWGVLKKDDNWKITNWMNGVVRADSATINDFIVKLDNLHGIPVKKNLSNPEMIVTIVTEKARTNVDIFYRNRKLYFKSGNKIFLSKGIDLNWLRLLPEKMADYRVFKDIKNKDDLKEIKLNSITSGGNKVYKLYRTKNRTWQIGKKMPWTASLNELGKLINELENISFSEFISDSGVKGNFIISLKSSNNLTTSLNYLKTGNCPAGEKAVIFTSGKTEVSGCIREKQLNLLTVPLPSLMETSVLAVPAANTWKTLAFSFNGEAFKLISNEKNWDVSVKNSKYPGDFITIEEWISTLKKITVKGKVDNLPCIPDRTIDFLGTLITWKLKFCTFENNIYLKRNDDFFAVNLPDSVTELFTRTWYDFVSRDLLEDTEPTEVKRNFKEITEHFRVMENGRITVLSPLDLPFSEKEITDYIGRLKNFRGLKYLPSKPVDASEPDIKTTIYYKEKKQVSFEIFNKGKYLFLNNKYFLINQVDSEWIIRPWTKDSIINWKITSAVLYLIKKSDGSMRTYINAQSHFTLMDKTKKIIPTAVMSKHLSMIEKYLNNIKAVSYGKLDKFDAEVQIKSSAGLPLVIRLKFGEKEISIENTARKIIYSGKSLKKPEVFFLLNDK